ncbi:MAG: hypothetical protein V1721_01500 [Pseudomonadota bacterium]
MVDAISALTMQSTVPRFETRDAGVSVSENSMLQAADMDFVISSIRVDNLQNVAILEYRSSRTGEVVQQFPTQAQIEAFRRAEQIQTAQKQALRQVMQHSTTPVIESPTVEAPSPAPVVQAAPSPAPVAIVSSGVSAGAPHSTQSVLA